MAAEKQKASVLEARADETDTSREPLYRPERGFGFLGGLGGNGPFLIILMSLFHMHSYFEALVGAHVVVFFFQFRREESLEFYCSFFQLG